MAGTWRATLAEIRNGWRALAALALVLGIAGGAALAALAGAQRTDTAVERFVNDSNAAQYEMDVSDLDDSDDALEQVRALPEVESAGRASYLLIFPDGWDFEVDGDPTILPLAAVDPEWTTDLDRPHLFEGRLADQSNPEEVTINRLMAERHGLGVGDTFVLQGWGASNMEKLQTGGLPVIDSPKYTFRVTGIIRSTGELTETDNEVVLITSAWYAEHGDEVVGFGPSITVRVDDLERGRVALERLLAEEGAPPDVLGSKLEEAKTIDRSARVQAIGLLVFAALAGLLAAAVVGQSIARQDVTLAATLRGLRALGLRRRELALIALGRVAVVALVGIALAVAVAIAASGLFPFGIVRPVEVDPGLRVDAKALALGTAALLITLAAVAVPVSFRTARLASVSPAAASSKGWLATVTGPFAQSAPAAVGVRMALDPGRGRAVVPVRSVTGGAVLGLAAVAATLVFGASLDRLSTEPKRFGWDFDVVMGTQDSESHVADEYAEFLAESDAVDGYSIVAGTHFVVGEPSDRLEVPIYGFDLAKGTVLPSIIEGRAPVGADEVALGREDLRRAGAQVGGPVTIRDRSGEPHDFTVSGMIVFPPDLSAPGGLGHGGVVTPAALETLAADEDVYRAMAFIDLAPGRSAEDLGEASEDTPIDVTTPAIGPDIENVRRVRGVPLALAVVMALVAVVTLGHALTAGVRRRRSELAVLRSLGFSGGQLLATTAWQATTFAAVAAVAGVPAGLLVGRWTWALVARDLGVADDAAFPWLALLVIVPAALVVANLLALGPGVSARRTHPAQVLRAE